MRYFKCLAYTYTTFKPGEVYSEDETSPISKYSVLYYAIKNKYTAKDWKEVHDHKEEQLAKDNYDVY